jgi:hypothetical protein
MNTPGNSLNKLTWFCSVYKADDYIVDYINDFLNQTNYEKIYLILINICNSHNNPIFVNNYIKDITKKYKNIKCIDLSEDPGLYECWKLAIQNIITKYITNANLDDRHHPDYSNIFTEYLDNHTECSVAISPCYVSNTYEQKFNTENKPIWFQRDIGDEIMIEEMYDEINKRSMNYPHSCPVWRREMHSKIGYFNPNEYGKIADYEFWLNVLKKGYKIKCVSDSPLYLYYFNENSYGNIDNKITNSIIIKTEYGLGNRLRALASAYSIAKKTNKKLYLIWIPDFHCDCNFNDLFSNNIHIINDLSIINTNDFDIYDYIVDKNKYINIDTSKNIFITSNCILNNEYRVCYFNEFLLSLDPVDEIKKIIFENDYSNCIGMHIRMDGGENYQTNQAELGSNWKDEEISLMYKYRNLSHIDNFIIQINNEINKDSNAKFFIATDLKFNYDKLINIYGDKIKYIKRDLYDRSLKQLYYAFADIYILSKCKKFYGSYWSSFTELVTYFQEEGTKKNNILSNEFNKNTREKISIVYGCKNRENNLLKSINSIINSDIIDDIVIVDFNCAINLRDFLKSNIGANLFYKINIIEVENNVPWILSYCYNIGFLYAKNSKIMKLDCDYIVSEDALKYFSNLDLTNNFYTFSWENAKTENQRHLNGFFFFYKELLNKFGYFNNNILFYGWDDDDLKNNFIKNNIDIKILDIDDNFVFHIESNNLERVKHYNNCITFFGFNIAEIIHSKPLILYNKILSETNNSITLEPDVLKIFSVTELYYKYCKIKLNFDNIQLYDNTNMNYLSENTKSICRKDIFENMCQSTNNELWINNIQSKLFKNFIEKYNIIDIDNKIVLFYIFFFNKVNVTKRNLKTNLVISLYNEPSITRCLELLYCLKQNTENEYITNIHILFETPHNDSFLFDIIKQLYDNNIFNFKKISITNIEKRPAYHDFFNYCNKNIIGNTIIANSDIVYDESLEYLKYLKNDDFISLTRYQKYNNIFKVIHFEEYDSKINCFSQDSWIFISPLKYNLECHMELGRMFCDSFLNYQLSKSMFKCYNLYNTIKSYHIQEQPSESEKITTEERNKQWITIYESIQYSTKNFILALKSNTLDDFINKNNTNNFINWDDYINEKI